MMNDLVNLGLYRGFPGLHISPYAQAIAGKYGRVFPWYSTVETSLTGVTRELKVVLTTPVNYDVLIIGAHTQIDDGSNGQNVLLQVSDLRTGYLWTVPSSILGSPSTAYGGVKSNVMPLLQLPEAFFLPKNVELKHEWKTYGTATGGSITWIGLALFDRLSDQDADWVEMPDGKNIRIGERLPWMNTIGLGDEISILGNPALVMGARNQYVAFSDSTERPVTITDLVANFFFQNGVTTNPNNVKISFADKGQAQTWSSKRASSTGFLGDPATGYPALPLPVPYSLAPGDRVQIGVLNRGSMAINNAYITLRGIQHGGI